MSEAYKEIGDILNHDGMRKVTGHGGRACLVTYLLLNGVTSLAVRQQTGHTNLHSMMPYNCLSAEA